MILADPLIINVRQHNKTAILEMVGDIDAAADTALNAAFARAQTDVPSQVLLNFAGVHYINSTGIAIIVALLAQSRRDKIPVLVCNLSEHYQEIFRITRLSDFMRIYADEASALQAE